MKVTREEVNKLLSYDPNTGVFTWKVSKGTAKAGAEAGCVWVECKSGKSYIQIRINGKLYYAHRLAWLILHGSLPDQQIDHIDGCGLNNKTENLRDVACAENNKNVRKRTDNTSGIVGVYWNKDCNKWWAYIDRNGERSNLGYFANYDEAKAVRKAAEIKFGFHANHGSERPL